MPCPGFESAILFLPELSADDSARSSGLCACRLPASVEAMLPSPS